MTPSILSFAVTFACILSMSYAEIVVKVFKCPGSTITQKQIHVPSYVFQINVTLRIIQNNFQPCSQMESADYFFKTNEEDELDVAEMTANSTYISPLGILSVEGKMYKMEEYCIKDYNELTSKLSLKYCPFDCDNSKTVCIPKCCPLGMSLDLSAESPCVHTPNRVWTGFFYDKDTWKRSSPKGEAKLNPHYVYTNLNCHSELWPGKDIQNDTTTKLSHRLLSNGRLIYIAPSRQWTLLERSVPFCIDGLVDEANAEAKSFLEEDQLAAVCGVDLESGKSRGQSLIYMYCLFGAAVFYFLTASIHLILWDKQNANGWLIFFLSLSMGMMVSFMGNAHKLGLDGDPELRGSALCIANAILGHFFFLSAFTWLTIINFDMWDTFREIKVISSGKNLGKLLYYGVFGFGGPATVVIVGLVLQHLYPDRESLVLVPEYGDNICFVAEWAQGVYIYYIIAALFVIIIPLFLMTCFTLYKFNKGTKSARSSSNAADRKMTKLYLKLAVVLGISWIFEFISWAVTKDGQHWIWMLPDLYNLLTSVFIFVIFGLKPVNLQQLEEKFPKIKPATSRIGHLMVTISSTSKELSTANTSASSVNNLTEKGGGVKMANYSSFEGKQGA